VLNGLLAAVIPLYDQTGPIRFGDRALVGLIALPANAVADFEESGLFAGHLLTNLTRFIHGGLRKIVNRKAS